MRSTTLSSLTRLDTTQSRWIRHVSKCASLASLASSATHDSCMVMRSGAVRCNPEGAAMTQTVTQTQAAGGRNDAGATGVSHPRRTTFAHVAILYGRWPSPYTTTDNAASWQRGGAAPHNFIGTPWRSFYEAGHGNGRGYRHSLFSLSDFL